MLQMRVSTYVILCSIFFSHAQEWIPLSSTHTWYGCGRDIVKKAALNPDGAVSPHFVERER